MIICIITVGCDVIQKKEQEYIPKEKTDWECNSEVIYNNREFRKYIEICTHKKYECIVIDFESPFCFKRK